MEAETNEIPQNSDRRSAYDREVNPNRAKIGCITFVILYFALIRIKRYIPEDYRWIFKLVVAIIVAFIILGVVKRRLKMQDTLDLARHSADDRFYEFQRENDEILRVQREQLKMREEALNIRDQHLQANAPPAIQKNEQAKDMDLF